MLFTLSYLLVFALDVQGKIDRHGIVSRYNPTRNTSSTSTPMQVGNGNFGFGADVTGLQTFQPFAIMSSWGWKNDSLPPGFTIADINNYKGVSWLNHGRPVQYDFGGGNPIEQWLTSNPNRVNLGRVGLTFFSETGQLQEITEKDLEETKQVLNLWKGVITSTFVFDGEQVSVETASAQDSDNIGINIRSTLVEHGRLRIFLDFPWNDGKNKFSAPFVGNWNATANHTTELHTDKHLTRITHKIDGSTFYTSVSGDDFAITRDSPSQHRYTIRPIQKSPVLSLTINFSPTDKADIVPQPNEVFTSSTETWEEFWGRSGFVDVVTGSTNTSAHELQRRIILSRYLMRVNEAGDTPPQESGLVNNGWYGKFHMEMYFWHSAHWALWNNWDLLRRSNSVYSRFLSGSISRAQVQQGWPAGARWPKMTDPSGRSAPGEINNLLIWQQVHPLVFALYEYRAFPSMETLKKWEDVVFQTAEWMTAFAWFNETTGVYDLGPPMFITSEDTSPNITQNPAFELAYWRLGLGIAENWMRNLGRDIPQDWTTVKENLAKLPIQGDTYAVYEGIEENFWDDPAFTSDHPTLVGLHGWLPPTAGLDIATANLTAEKVGSHWNATDFWGWDFPMLAMSAARNGLTSKAIDWLLDPLFAFDEVGMPIGGVRVPTPYFPGSGALLYAVAVMAAGWDDSLEKTPGFPSDGWNVQFEGLSKGL